jgi:hypothetical protein
LPSEQAAPSGVPRIEISNFDLSNGLEAILLLLSARGKPILSIKLLDYGIFELKPSRADAQASQ